MSGRERAHEIVSTLVAIVDILSDIKTSALWAEGLVASFG